MNPLLFILAKIKFVDFFIVTGELVWFSILCVIGYVAYVCRENIKNFFKSIFK